MRRLFGLQRRSTPGSSLQTLLLLTVTLGHASLASDPSQLPPAERGFRYLANKPYLPPDFDQETFDNLWKVWPQALKEKARKASPATRRKLAFSRYGLTGRPDDSTKPLQYVVDERGSWTMNCFACHGGKVLGKAHPGLPNSHYALETLTADARKVKLMMGKPLSRMDVGSMVVPLGKTNGTTNAVMFGVALMSYRDAELNYHSDRSPPKMVHHDMDAPPWWQFKRKTHIYIDAFAEKGHRALMQFMLVKENGPKDFQAWESDFRDVYAYLESVEPPEYPFDVDSKLAERGQVIFNDNCARCHGTYGRDGEYPNEVVPIDEVATDRVRFDALSASDRLGHHQSWFAHFGQRQTRIKPAGYIAPPLDGIWASAPYFHNGSVPTLWHIMNPGERPTVWKRSEDGYDETRVGLEVEEFEKLPASIRGADELRTYFNAARFGKSNQGHTFPDQLSSDEKTSVLEYLKTL